LGIGLKRQLGDFALSGALSASYGNEDINRWVAAPGVVGRATASSDLYTASARGRVAYRLAGERGYIRPFLDLDAIHINAGGYTESGAGIFNLNVADESRTALVATPAVEAGIRLDAINGWDARILATAGVSFSTEDEWTTNAALVSAPAGAGSFHTSLPVADVLGRLGLSLQLSGPGGFDIRAEYGGAFGDDYSCHSGFLNLVKRF